MNIRTLLVDDEVAARSRLRKMLLRFSDITLLDEARDGVEAVEMISRLAPDLVFLDVQMPGMDGFEVLRALPAGAGQPLVVFVTAFDSYALQAFDANAVAYLLKPTDREKLGLAVERVTRLLSAPKEASEQRRLQRSLAEAAPGVMSHVTARMRDRYLPLPLEDVCFFRVEDAVTRVKTAGAIYWTEATLAALEQRLPENFFRAHRSTIVNLHMIAEIARPPSGAFALVMKDDRRSTVQVSERQTARIRDLLRS